MNNLTCNLCCSVGSQKEITGNNPFSNSLALQRRLTFIIFFLPKSFSVSGLSTGSRATALTRISLGFAYSARERVNDTMTPFVAE